MPSIQITADPRILPSPRWPDSLPWYRRHTTHALIIGGTGMLSGVALALAGAADTVSIVARDRRRLDALARCSRTLRRPAAINPISVDYASADGFTRALSAATAAHGPVTLAVAWIHPTAPHALPAAARTLAAAGPLRLFHILGSSAAVQPLPDGAAATRNEPGILYRRIILGFIPDPTGGPSRWLTHDEITTGILRAIELDARETTIGTTTPWSARPT